MPREDDVRRIVLGGRAKNLSDDEIRALVKRYDERTGTAPMPAHEPEQQKSPAGGWLPVAGSFIGSAVGTVGGVPGRIAGAGLGGAFGKGAEMFFDEKDDTLAESAKAMGIEGAKQAAFETAGGLAGQALKAGGGLLYKGGVALLPRTLKQEFPNMAKAGLREGIALTRRGAEKAGRLGAESANLADDVIAKRAAQTAAMRGLSNPGRAPGFVGLPDALQDVPDLMRSASQSALGTKDPALRQLIKLSKTTSKGHQWPMQLPEAQGLKRAEQGIAHGIYRTIDKGGHVPATARTRAQFAKSVASGTRRKIEQEVPEVAGINARTQDLLGLERGAEHASETGHILSRLGAAGGAGLIGSGAGVVPALGAAAAGAALSTPGGLTRAGLMTRSLQKPAEWTPEAIRALILMQQLQEQGGQ